MGFAIDTNIIWHKGEVAEPASFKKSQSLTSMMVLGQNEIVLLCYMDMMSLEEDVSPQRQKKPIDDRLLASYPSLSRIKTKIELGTNGNSDAMARRLL